MSVLRSSLDSISQEFRIGSGHHCVFFLNLVITLRIVTVSVEYSFRGKLFCLERRCLDDSDGDDPLVWPRTDDDSLISLRRDRNFFALSRRSGTASSRQCVQATHC